VVDGQVAGGGPIAAVNSRCQAVAQGHRVGSRRVARRAERVTLAATVISWVRMVAVTALAWNRPARAPTAGQVERHRGQHQPRGIGCE